MQTPTSLRPLARATVALLALLSAASAAPATPAAGVVELEDMTWTELRAAIAAGTRTAIVPIGGTEQNGPAMTLGKHNFRVRALSERIARDLGRTVVAPVVAYVPEGRIDPPTSHMRFAGTLGIDDEAFERTLDGAARSLKAAGFEDIVFLGDHGGYRDDVRRVVERLNRAWHGARARCHAPAAYYDTSESGFAAWLRSQGYRDDEIGTHAGLADTSLQMAIAPSSVRAELLGHAHWGPADGIYGGDPSRASAELGRQGVERIVAATVAAIRDELGRPR